MKIGDIADKAETFFKSWDRDEFIYQFLAVYGTASATIKRLKSGDYNQAKVSGEVLLKDKVYFRPVGRCDLYAELEKLEAEKVVGTYKPRFLIVTDSDSLVARDTKLDELLDIKLADFVENCYFFQPLAGFEKVHFENEKEADVKASDKMAKLFDDIIVDNPDFDRHALNVFLTRILFCLFAEDTNIFQDNAFADYLNMHTERDGSDIHGHIKDIFDVLDSRDRKDANQLIKQFPYVNGGLFKDHYEIPHFSAKSRRMLIDCGRLNWAEIHPDIFGSMFQAVIDPEIRHDLGMHYTSVTNIMKVIKPLFLDNLYEELEKAKGNKKRLEKLVVRISRLKIFDPACGSGNFLIIAYKELRILEMAILAELQKVEQNTMLLSQITVQQFYGIEYDDFACEVATLAMWLAEHQMNLEFTKTFGKSIPSLPLRDGARITCGNACRIPWDNVCPKTEENEIFLLGNPPYLGARMQNEEQKSDMGIVFGAMKGVNSLDYISCWFYLGAKYIQGSNAQLAFVWTNSICQGEQVALLWSEVLDNSLEIGFAHQSFKWSNNAKKKAAVICVIVGVRNLSKSDKKLYKNGLERSCKNINAYLTDSGSVYVYSRRKSLSSIPPITFGSMANDGGGLALNKSDLEFLTSQSTSNRAFVRKFLGSSEFIRGTERWCLWLTEDNVEDALKSTFIQERVEAVKIHRQSSSREATQKLAKVPYRFGEVRHKDVQSLIIPKVSSERREYRPVGFLNQETIISDLAFAIYSSEPWIFTVVSSCMHMTWIRAVAGRLKTDYRYSAGLCYNTFPIPDLSKKQKEQITEKAINVLAVRERYPEKTMADLYDPDKMPDDLRQAHHKLDLTVDAVYRAKPFANDEERLEFLFKLYEKMIGEEKNSLTKKRG